jgi:polysaccharide pyruvyl transferase WcaK-like protein
MIDNTPDLEKPRFILAGMCPYENRGCEAIMRGSVKILRNHFHDPSFLSLSITQETDFDSQVRNETDKAIIHKKLNYEEYITKKPFLQRIVFTLDRKKNKYLLCNEMLPHLDEARAVLSVGGDNYSLDYGVPKLFTDLDDVVLGKKRPLILWGASVGPFDRLPRYEKYMKRHLRKVTAIFARESVSVEYLKKIGVTENVYQVADPAFLMDPVEPRSDNKKLTVKHGAIGLNLSPLMARYVTGGNVPRWEQIAANIISTIVKKTNRPVYLIPHVTMPRSNDFTFLENARNLTDPQIQREINLIPPYYNAAETKWIISNMSLFAGARTHSTIASLSSCVPTLSFAYSIKAKGINRDIFGHEDYCLDPVQLTSEIVTSCIESMLAHADGIKKELKEKIPCSQKSAMNAGKFLKEVLDGP